MEYDRQPRVAIIDNSICPDVYRPVEHWSRHIDLPWDAFVAREGRFPRLADHTHIILTGSEASILERDAWVEEEAALVRRAVAAGLPILGSCWGHQLLAYALAGASHVRRCLRPEIGWIPLRLTKDTALLGPAGSSPYTFSVHYDEVMELPETFELLASSEACPVQAIKLKERPVWGLQCHPEVDIPTAQTFLRDLIARGFKGRDALLAALDGPPRDSGLIHRIVPAFLASGLGGEGNH